LLLSFAPEVLFPLSLEQQGLLLELLLATLVGDLEGERDLSDLAGGIGEVELGRLGALLRPVKDDVSGL
jgi:hypothetical protein